MMQSSLFQLNELTEQRRVKRAAPTFDSRCQNGSEVRPPYSIGRAGVLQVITKAAGCFIVGGRLRLPWCSKCASS